MAATLPEALRAPITDLASGKAWLEALSAADLTFHLEDDPADIVSGLTGERTFRDEDVPLLRRRVAELYRLDWGIYDCPIGYTLVLCAEAGRIPFWTAGDLIEYANGLEAEVVKVGADANRHRAILKCSTGFMVASKTREQYAADDFSDDFEERELFPSVEEALGAAGGAWE